MGFCAAPAVRSGCKDRRREQEWEGRAAAPEALTAKPGAGRRALQTGWAVRPGRSVSFRTQVVGQGVGQELTAGA